MGIRTVIAIACCVASSGCATNIAARDAALAEFQSTVPTCTGEAQCKAMWEAAQVWVAQHSDMKIQTATDVLIETYGGGQYSATLSMRVLKVPQGGGSYRIEFSGGCNNVFGCVPDRLQAGTDFNRAVGAATP